MFCCCGLEGLCTPPLSDAQRVLTIALLEIVKMKNKKCILGIIMGKLCRPPPPIHMLKF